MLYSDKENKDWWARLSKLERYELLAKINERATMSHMQVWVKQIQRKLDRGEELKIHEIQNLRKWE